MESLKKYKILIVDDNKNFLKVLRFHLLDAINLTFNQIDEANNGQEAVQMARESHYDFIFMDIEMPVMDGIEATRTIKLDNPLNKIIAMSLYNNNEFKVGMSDAGADGYVMKDNLDETVIMNVIKNVK